MIIVMANLTSGRQGSPKQGRPSPMAFEGSLAWPSPGFCRPGLGSSRLPKRHPPSSPSLPLGFAALQPLFIRRKGKKQRHGTTPPR
ncbi:hypothetical protein NL676_020048 [Syzygium grande]|nr:hypothetical protein NL676_020048 [Syzygium grande]